MFFLLPHTPLARRNTTAPRGGNVEASGRQRGATEGLSGHLGSFRHFRSLSANDDAHAVRVPLAPEDFRF